MSIAMREAWGTALVELGRDVPELVVLDGDLGTSTKADKFAAAYPDRFLQMGIAEQNLVGAAAGLATTGMIAWLSSFGVFFSHRALDPIRMLVAQTNANVKIAAGYTGICFGMAGKSHHDHADLAIMRAMPGMVVLAPGDAAECAAMTRWATAYEGPVYLRVARDPGPDLPPAGFELGAVRELRSGTTAVLVSTGSQTARTLQAAELAAADGLDLRVLHLPTIKPLDEQSLIEAIGDAPYVVTVEDHSTFGGLGGLVAEIVSGGPRPVPVRRIGLADTWVESGSNDYLLDRYGLSAEAVAAQVTAIAEELS
ncbi:transketolase [Saccharopolyspora subtropica]|uniref:Transketolase n=1 Tax=Saccharopolyspora thermophila TaxID=89367 RepID=A0A917NHY3_9PSEU|nr:transketolase C-terminal domain-containing protein [Saccharopolyspora subtropica]GGJ01887.1 transketolase [Saccharopolyspora subtropica]